MSFLHCPAPQRHPDAADLAVVIAGEQLLVHEGATDTVDLPNVASLAGWANHWPEPVHLGLLDERPCWLYTPATSTSDSPAGWVWQETRTLLGAFNSNQWHAIASARELTWWHNRNRFCGCCGEPLMDSANERAKRCPMCGAMFFPSIAPAVIVAVTRSDRLLLAHNKNFRAGMFSLLAGFVEPGETLEQTVVREVHEEASIEIGELRYITSQPWPFPNSLMAGFRAVHVAGEIKVDGLEIEQADWFSRDALPDIPRPGTVARTLIDAWLREPHV